MVRGESDGSGVGDPASIVVVPQRREPGAGVIGRAAHHPLEDLVELVLGRQVQGGVEERVVARITSFAASASRTLHVTTTSCRRASDVAGGGPGDRRDRSVVDRTRFP